MNTGCSPEPIDRSVWAAIGCLGHQVAGGDRASALCRDPGSRHRSAATTRRSPASRELGTDFGIAGQWWADRVAVAWEAVVRSSFRSIRTEAERRARRGTAHS